MTAARLDTWIWVLIFGGLLLLGPGIALLRAGAGWGWTLIVLGAVLAAIGVVLIVVRSRMPEDATKP